MSQTCKDCSKPISTGSKTGYCRICSRKHFPVWNRGLKETRPDVIEKMSVKKRGKAPPNKGKNISLDQRIQLSCVNRDIPIEKFDDFTTEETRRERNRFADLGLSRQCFDRDGFKCDCCGLDRVALNAHHLNSWKHFPDQRFELSNLISLCYTCHRSFHNICGNGKHTPNTAEQYYEFKLTYNSNPVKKDLYIVAGVSGSGKSWVCSNFKDIYMEYDSIPKKHARSIIYNHKSDTIIYDPTVHVSTFIKRNSDIFNIKLVVIQEPKETVVSRLISRGGKETPSLSRRILRMRRLAETAAVFSGSSDEVLEYLRTAITS